MGEMGLGGVSWGMDGYGYGYKCNCSGQSSLPSTNSYYCHASVIIVLEILPQRDVDTHT